MFILLLGFAVLGGTGLLFWVSFPKKGKVRRWITPSMEPMVAVVLVLGTGVGGILVVLGAASILS